MTTNRKQRLAGIKLPAEEDEHLHPEWGVFGVRCADDEISDLRIVENGHLRVIENPHPEDENA